MINVLKKMIKNRSCNNCHQNITGLVIIVKKGEKLDYIDKYYFCSKDCYNNYDNYYDDY